MDNQYISRMEREFRNTSTSNFYRSPKIPSLRVIIQAFLWMKMPTLDESLKEIFNTIQFIAYAVSKGVTADETQVQREKNIVHGMINYNANTSIIVINTINNRNLGDALLNYYKETEGYTEVEGTRTYLVLSPYHRVHLLSKIKSNEKVEYILFTNRIDAQVWFRLSGAILYDALENIEDETWVKDISEALGSDRYDAYLEMLNAKCVSVLGDINTALFEEIVSKLDKQVKEVSLSKINAQIERYRQQIAGLENQYSNAVNALQSARNRYIGCSINTEDLALADFIRANRAQIPFIQLVRERLYIVYTTKLLYWSEDIFKTLRTHGPRYISNHPNAAVDYMITKVFEERTHSLWFEEAVCISVETYDSDIRYIDRDRLVNNDADGYMTLSKRTGIDNPHHKYYNCWGDNKPAIIKALTESDYPVALAQIFAAIAGINFSDGIVMEDFFIRTFADRSNTINQIPCIEVNKTGERITIEELYNRREQDEDDTSNEQAD